MIRLLFAFVFLLVGCQPKPTPSPTLIGQTMSQQVGLQLYSLRDDFAKDVPGTLDYVANTLKIKNIETAGYYNLSVEAFKTELDKRGLVPQAALFSYEQWRDSVELIVRECQVLGVRYAGCAWINHEDNHFGRADMEKAIDIFNRAAQRLDSSGIRFYYHTHGYEFQPSPEGTLFDLMAQRLDPQKTAFEMDTYWVQHAGLNPADLLRKYKGRFVAMHLKDMDKRQATGIFTGHSPVEYSVTIGTGQLDMPTILTAAIETGVPMFFVEDESPTVRAQLPVTLGYLKSL
jgi:sugar phosphate isomerase/epimerase